MTYQEQYIQSLIELLPPVTSPITSAWASVWVWEWYDRVEYVFCKRYDAETHTWHWSYAPELSGTRCEGYRKL